MRFFIIFIFSAALIAITSTTHIANAGISVDAASADRRYENDGTALYYGKKTSSDHNYFASGGFDSWYLVTQYPAASTDQVNVHELDFGAASVSGSNANWTITEAGSYGFNVDLEFSFDSDGFLQVDGTLTYNAPNSFFPLTPVRAEIFNLVKYTDATQANADFVSVSTGADPNHFQFNSPADISVFRSASGGTSDGLAPMIGVADSVEEDLINGGGKFVADSVASGGFKWSFNFDGLDSSSNPNIRTFSTLSSVPEPSSLLYAAIFGLTALGFRRTR